MGILVSELAEAAVNEFSFLEKIGLSLVERTEFAPEDFRGGFKLVFRGAFGKEVTIVYSDYEFDVRLNGDELFGSSKHDSFAGNMFSREHLLPALPRIRAAIESALRDFALTAT